MSSWISLVVAVLVSNGAGLVGALATSSSVSTWYQTLVRPELAPPSWVFGPVWTLLYTLIGISVWMIWNKGFERTDVKIALMVFLIQLILNVVWSFVFFNAQELGWAFAEICVLWMSIVAMMILFYPLSRTATFLLVPYLLWVSFASYLNYMFWSLN